MKREHAKKCCRGGAHYPVKCYCECNCDGYHTFDELYQHRVTLFIALCKWFTYEPKDWRHVWRSKLHSDGSNFDGWFVMGIGDAKGEQITYHLPIKEWQNTEWAETLDKAPEFDGHTSDDVLQRLRML